MHRTEDPMSEARAMAADLPSHSARTERLEAVESTLASTIPAQPITEHDRSLEVPPDSSDEFKLPSLGNLIIILFGNLIHQTAAYIPVSSASGYAQYLGGSDTFYGLIIGVPNVLSVLSLLSISKLDKGTYRIPMFISYSCFILGSLLYALAYRASFLYLILIGRVITGIGFTVFMYCKRYCSDPRVVGIRRRTTLASWLVVGQGAGLGLGPFLGGVLYKIGFPNDVFNGYTSTGWLISATYIAFAGATAALFSDVPARAESASVALRRMIRRRFVGQSAHPSVEEQVPRQEFKLSRQQKGVFATILWFQMTNAFILSGFESSIPVYSNVIFGYTPFNAGNFIALGALIIFPILLLNMRYSRLVQDRVILASGSAIGLTGLIIMLFIVHTERVTRASYLVVWVLVALGINLASTCTMSLLSKQLPGEWNGRISLALQYAIAVGRVAGSIWGGASVSVGMMKFLGLNIAMVGIGSMMYMTLWRELKAKTG